MSTCKTGIFIDGNYWEKVASTLGFKQVRLGSLIKMLLEGQDEPALSRTYYYTAEAFLPQNYSAEDKSRHDRRYGYLMALQDTPGVTLRACKAMFSEDAGVRTLRLKGGAVQLAVDAMVLAVRGGMEEAILLGGDGDLVPLVVALKNHGVRVTLLHASRSLNESVGGTSRDLIVSPDQAIEITPDMLGALLRATPRG